MWVFEEFSSNEISFVKALLDNANHALVFEVEVGIAAYVYQKDYTVKPVYNDHPMGYFSAFWSSSRWPRAT